MAKPLGPTGPCYPSLSTRPTLVPPPPTTPPPRPYPLPRQAAASFSFPSLLEYLLLRCGRPSPSHPFLLDHGTGKPRRWGRLEPLCRLAPLPAASLPHANAQGHDDQIWPRRPQCSTGRRSSDMEEEATPRPPSLAPTRNGIAANPAEAGSDHHARRPPPLRLASCFIVVGFGTTSPLLISLYLSHTHTISVHRWRSRGRRDGRHRPGRRPDPRGSE
jgi:hypothetical protein